MKRLIGIIISVLVATSIAFGAVFLSFNTDLLERVFAQTSLTLISYTVCLLVGMGLAMAGFLAACFAPQRELTQGALLASVLSLPFICGAFSESLGITGLEALGSTPLAFSLSATFVMCAAGAYLRQSVVSNRA